jgi:hypothetical protein
MEAEAIRAAYVGTSYEPEGGHNAVTETAEVDVHEPPAPPPPPPPAPDPVPPADAVWYCDVDLNIGCTLADNTAMPLTPSSHFAPVDEFTELALEPPVLATSYNPFDEPSAQPCTLGSSEHAPAPTSSRLSSREGSRGDRACVACMDKPAIVTVRTPIAASGR